jgi:protein-S-isoprenylcysteine O-methyltransferase Ste14
MLHGTWPVFIAGVAIFLFVYYAIIFSEEAFLADKFGESFTAYCKQVPRLLPKLSNRVEATKGMQFSWKRAVYGEYNIIGQAVLMIALALWYEGYRATGVGVPPLSVVALLIGGILFVLAIRTLKRR